jgi:hypothetical protein
LKETLYAKLENNQLFSISGQYRNRIPESGTTISGFADSKKEEKINTDPRFF